MLRVKGKRFLVLLMGVGYIGGCSPTGGPDISDRVDGFTETDAQGRIIRVDPDDWRIQRNYLNLVTVEPAYPNPTGTGVINLVFRFSLPSPIRLEIIGTNINNNPVLLGSFSPPAFGSDFYTLNLLALSPSRNIAELRGRLFRLRCFDGAGNLITYGDILIN